MKNTDVPLGGAGTGDVRRDAYLETLLKSHMNGFVKIITGIRRCGKSFLLNLSVSQYLRPLRVFAPQVEDQREDLV